MWAKTLQVVERHVGDIKVSCDESAWDSDVQPRAQSCPGARASCPLCLLPACVQFHLFLKDRDSYFSYFLHPYLSHLNPVRGDKLKARASSGLIEFNYPELKPQKKKKNSSLAHWHEFQREQF